LFNFGGIGKAFSERNFRIYTVGSITSWVSFFIQLLAVNWLTWELTKSTTWLAIITFLDIAPNLYLYQLEAPLPIDLTAYGLWS